MASRVVFVALLVVCASQTVLGQQADPRREPGTAILEAVRLLERKDYSPFLKAFMLPDDLKEALATQSLEQFAAAFAQKHAGNVLILLKTASKMKPTLNPAGTRAEYRFEQPVAGSNHLRLMKVGEYWFLED